jgi:hypothetical protein
MEKIKDWEIVDWICATVAVLWCVSVATVVIIELIG